MPIKIISKILIFSFLIFTSIFSKESEAQSITVTVGGPNAICEVLCELRFEGNLTVCDLDRGICVGLARGALAAAEILCSRVRGTGGGALCSLGARQVFDAEIENCRVREGECAQSAGRAYNRCLRRCRISGSAGGGSPR